MKQLKIINYKLKIVLLLLVFTGVANAQWAGTSLRTDGKYRAAKNTATYLGKGADSVFAQLVYLVNQDSISTDVRIDSIKAILGRLETQLIALNAKDFATAANQGTANSSLSNINSELTTLNAKDFATAANQSAQTTKLTNIETELNTLNAKDFATAANQSTANTTLSNINSELTTLNAKDFATAANQGTANTTLSNIKTNTDALNITSMSISEVNYSSFTQLASTAIKGITIYNYSSSNAYISFDGGTNYITLYPNTYWRGEGIRNANILYVKGNVKIEYRN